MSECGPSTVTALGLTFLYEDIERAVCNFRTIHICTA
jgi:hypothetical protein